MINKLLDGGFNHLEKYEFVRWEGLSHNMPYILKNKSHVPNHHQPVIHHHAINQHH
jgi:hypothetical protein